MTTFDGWEARLCGDAMALPTGMISEDYLMHFRTKGSKNGVRRYQQTDGTWTPLGLKLRKEREGWGETKKERKAEKRVAKAEKKAVKAEKKAARVKEKNERAAAAKERLLKSKKHGDDLSGLSDAELQQKINRVKMEQEYKELTKSPLLKIGEKAFANYVENRVRRAELKENQAKREVDLKRIEADIIRSKESTKKARQEKLKARQEKLKVRQDRKAGLAIERAEKLKRAKIDWKATTLHGGIIRRLNSKMTAGINEKYKKIREQEGKNRADEILRRYNRDASKQKAYEAKLDVYNKAKEDRKDFDYYYKNVYVKGQVPDSKYVSRPHLPRKPKKPR